jgi:hypothetical protein
MERLAQKMCNDYFNQLFWDHLHTLAEPFMRQAGDNKEEEEHAEGGDTRR